MSNNIITGFTPSGFGGTTGLPVCCPDLKNGHGQCVAGIIGAIKDNNTGVAGIAPLCKMTSVNIVTGYETEIQMADGINWAWNNATSDILSMQFHTQSSDAITNAITLGRNGKGCVVVSGSGNGYSNGGFFPGNVNNVITVGAINNNGNIWSYSNTGSSMDLVAPSGDAGNGLTGDIRTIDRMGNLGYYTTNYTGTFGGTSAAAPQVAGVAALMLSVNPNLTETQVRTILQQTATDMGAVGFDNTYGYGRVNACAAVIKAQIMAGTISISGENSICSGSQTYTVNNLPQGATVIWTRTPTTTTNLTQNNNIATLTKTSNGLVTLTATISGCGQSYTITKNINVGFPYTLWNPNGCTFPEAVLETGEDSGPCNSQCYTPSDSKWWCAAPVYNATNVTWQKMYSLPANYSFWSGCWSGNKNFVSIMFKSPNQFVELKTTITNPCGSIEQYYCFTSTNTLCSGNFKTTNCKQYEVSFIANSNRLNIKNKNEICEGINSISLNIIQIVDKVGNVTKEIKYNDKQSFYEIDLTEVKNDIYFVLLQYDNMVETHQIGIFK